MSMRGTPWYDMALDGGYRGAEAEQVARRLEEQYAYYEQARAEQARVEYEQHMAELYEQMRADNVSE